MKFTKREDKKIKVLASFLILWIVFWIWVKKIMPLYNISAWIYLPNIMLITLLLILWNAKK